MQTTFEDFEDIIELDITLDQKIELNSLHWVKYNPRKDIQRWGCSITSLNGQDKGIPDLDSLLEFNKLNLTNFTEKDFKLLTKHAEPFRSFLNSFDCGRSHYLKFGSGGFFPWHRDSDLECFRIIYTIENCDPHNLVWVEDKSVLELQDRKCYYINTKKKHCLFAFNTAILAVFNVLKTPKNFSKLLSSFRIK